MKTIPNFIPTMYQMFPDSETTGTITRKQLKEVKDQMNCDWPDWLMQNKIARGVYRLPTSESPMKELKIVSIPKGGSSLVPEKDPNFVPFGNFKDLESIIKSGIFYPSYIYGPTGNGKSTMVEQICAKHKKPLIRVNLNQMTDEEQLIGSKTLQEGNVEVVEGPVLVAMRNGYTILLDECLEENQSVRIGTMDEYQSIPLKDLEFNTIYPVVSFNMETGELENDLGSIISDRMDDVFEVELEDGRMIVLNSKHPFIVFNNGVFSEKTLEMGLQVGDEIVVF